jgi:hypothetical protein
MSKPNFTVYDYYLKSQMILQADDRVLFYNDTIFRAMYGLNNKIYMNK